MQYNKMTKQEHNKIAKMEEHIKSINERLILMPTIEGMKLSNKELLEEMCEKLSNEVKKSDDKYASKLTERIVYGAVWIIVSGVILTGLGFLLVKIY